VSSLLGLLIVIAILAYGLRPGRPEDALQVRPVKSLERRTWIVAYLVVAAGLSGLLFLWRRHASLGIPSMPVSHAAIAILRAAAASLLVIAAALYLRLRVRPGEPVTDPPGASLVDPDG
jgi:hypothetical protein